MTHYKWSFVQLWVPVPFKSPQSLSLAAKKIEELSAESCNEQITICDWCRKTLATTAAAEAKTLPHSLLPSTPPLLLYLAYLRYLKHFDWTSVAELVLSQIAEQHRVESYSVRPPPSPAAGATFKWTWLPLPRARHLRFLSLRSLWPAPSKQRGRESRRCGTADVWKARPVQPSK